MTLSFHTATHLYLSYIHRKLLVHLMLQRVSSVHSFPKYLQYITHNRFKGHKQFRTHNTDLHKWL